MSTQLTEEMSEIYLENWMPGVIPTLKKQWADYVFARPSGRRLPNLGDWLTLLHVAAVKPDLIAQHLARLLEIEGNEPALQNDWAILVDLFALTFEASQTDEANSAWQNLVKLQHRILKVAAELSQIRKTRPATHILERRALYLKTITDLSNNLATIQTMPDLLNQVVGLIQLNFGYDYVHIFLLNPAKQILALSSVAWPNQTMMPSVDSISFKINEGIVGQAATTGRVVLVNEVAKYPQFMPFVPTAHVQSQLAAPLLVGNNLVGVLDIQSNSINAFNDDDRQIARALADRVAIAIDSIQLRIRLEMRARVHKLLQESDFVLDMDSDVIAVLKHMARKIAEVMEAGACVISQVDEKTRLITPLAEYVVRYPGNPSGTWRAMNQPLHFSKDPLAEQVLKTGRPTIQWADMDKSTETAVWAMPQNRQGSWGVVLALPLGTKRGPIGLLEIYDKNKNRHFSGEDIQVCRILARQSSLAMERASLLDETYRRLSDISLLYTMTQKVPHHAELGTILNAMVEFMRQMMGCRGCAIYLLNPHTKSLEIKAAMGLKANWPNLPNLHLGEGPIGLAASEKRIIYLPDTRKVANLSTVDKEVRSLMVAPLLSGTELLGTITLDDGQPNAFDQVQQQTLTIAAAQISLAIDNAQLLADLKLEQQRFEVANRYMNEGLLFINAEGKISWCNRMLETLLELYPNQLIGQNVTASNLPPNLVKLLKVSVTDLPYKEITLDTWYHSVVRVFAAPIVNVHNQTLGEMRLVQDVSHLHQTTHLTDEIAATISQQLQPIVETIQTTTQTLLNDQAADYVIQKSLLLKIQSQVDELEKITAQPMSLSSEIRLVAQGFSQEPVAIRSVINHAMLGLQSLAQQQQVALLSKLPTTMPIVLGDAQRLEQVIMYLIGNAVKHSRLGGKVVIKASVTGEEILVEIKDSGRGIPPEKIKSIFAPTFKDKITGSGSLPFAHQLITAHGGRIWVDSQLGHGSRFCFTLPLLH